MPENISVSVAGGGSWGTALAHRLALNGHTTTLWLRDDAIAKAINSRHENPRYLGGFALHPALKASLEPAALGGNMLVCAVPVQALRAFVRENKQFFRPGVTIVNTAKGLETQSLAPCSKIIADELADIPCHYAVLSGPSFAAEVLRGLPTAVVLAAGNKKLGEWLRGIFSSPAFRCYSSADVTGVEMGGALKNVLAIAVGICDGLHFGYNSRAALITRGIAEISRLGVPCGAKARTFMGLSGLGDLILTCTGDLSRNRQVGLRLASGESLETITESLGMVAEGVKTAAAVYKLAENLRVEAPVARAVYSILYEGQSPKSAATHLMTRTLREE
jgi:glycerol-3-phosphate dehydrogenase (NAD(P)+)